jgi:hypothetical protein
MRDTKGLMERKGKKMFEKIRNNKDGFKSKDKNGQRNFGDKAKAKILKKM